MPEMTSIPVRAHRRGRSIVVAHIRVGRGESLTARRLRSVGVHVNAGTERRMEADEAYTQAFYGGLIGAEEYNRAVRRIWGRRRTEVMVI